MLLKIAHIVSAKPKSRPYQLNDGDGLKVVINPSGRKDFHVWYTPENGKPTRCTIGRYPPRKLESDEQLPEGWLTLAGAREERDRVLVNIAKGYPPFGVKTRKNGIAPWRPSNQTKPWKTGALKGNRVTFRDVCEAWLDTQTWTGKSSFEKARLRLNKHVYPFETERGFLFGDLFIGDVTVHDIVDLLKAIEDLGETRNKVKGWMNRVFFYGVLHFPDAIKANPMAGMPTSELKKKTKTQHRKKLAFDKSSQFLIDIVNWANKRPEKSQEVAWMTVLYIKLLMLTMVRPGELRLAVWSEFDFKKRLWRIPEERMKASREHIVPLSDQAVELLEKLREITGNYVHLFPKRDQSNNSKVFDDTGAMSNCTAQNNVKARGYDIHLHGFRGMASTFLGNAEDENEYPRFESRHIEFALAHEDENRVRAAYDANRYLKQRTRMLQWYADQLMPKTN